MNILLESVKTHRGLIGFAAGAIVGSIATGVGIVFISKPPKKKEEKPAENADAYTDETEQDDE